MINSEILDHLNLATSSLYKAFSYLLDIEADLTDTKIKKVIEEKERRVQDIFTELYYLQESLKKEK